MEIAGLTIPQIAALIGVASKGTKLLSSGADLVGKLYRGAKQVREDLKFKSEFGEPSYITRSRGYTPPSSSSYSYTPSSGPVIKTVVKRKKKKRGNRSKYQDLIDLFG